MTFLSKPLGSGAVYSLLFLLQLITLVSAITIDAKSCAPYKANVEAAVKEAQEIANYAQWRTEEKSPRFGNLMMDMLHASNEDDHIVLQRVRAVFKEVDNAMKIPTSAKNHIVIHCDDDHLTKTAPSTPHLFFDNSNGRQARVQGLQRSDRKKDLGACGGFQKAFQYDFIYVKNEMKAKAIVLCSDHSMGALKSAEPGKKVADYRNSNLAALSPGIDGVPGKILTTMLLHELMHATDSTAFPLMPGGHPAELYGYKQITGRNVGEQGTLNSGPDSKTRLANADSWALLGAGWFLNNHAFVEGKILNLNVADRVPGPGANKRDLEARKKHDKPKGDKKPFDLFKPKDGDKKDDKKDDKKQDGKKTPTPTPTPSKPTATPTPSKSSSSASKISSSSSSSTKYLLPIQTIVGKQKQTYPKVGDIAKFAGPGNPNPDDAPLMTPRPNAAKATNTAQPSGFKTKVRRN